MKRKSRITTEKPHRRSGLAPVEMVLLTPFLVFLGALMVNFGDAASWKIKSHSNSHYAATQSQAFRRSSYIFDRSRNPRPSSWPTQATLTHGSGSRISQLENQFWNQELQEYSEALMGNPLQDPYGQIDGWSKDVPPPQANNRFDVRRRMFAERGVHRGNAGIRKRFPIAAILKQSEFNLNDSMEMLSGDWDYGHVGLGRNENRRVAALYDVEPNQGMVGSAVAALQSFGKDPNLTGLTSAPGVNPPFNKHSYDVLDFDKEYHLYAGAYRNFHTHPSGCELEWIDYGFLPANRGQSLAIQLTRFDRYLLSIRGKPRELGDAWMQLYNREIYNQEVLGLPPRHPQMPSTKLREEVQKLDQYLRNLQGLGY